MKSNTKHKPNYTIKKRNKKSKSKQTLSVKKQRNKKGGSDGGSNAPDLIISIDTQTELLEYILNDVSFENIVFPDEASALSKLDKYYDKHNEYSFCFYVNPEKIEEGIKVVKLKIKDGKKVKKNSFRTI